MTYELPETIADGTPIEPCGLLWSVIYEKDGLWRRVTSQEASDHKQWLSAGLCNYDPYNGLIKGEINV